MILLNFEYFIIIFFFSQVQKEKEQDNSVPILLLGTESEREDAKKTIEEMFENFQPFSSSSSGRVPFQCTCTTTIKKLIFTAIKIR